MEMGGGLTILARIGHIGPATSRKWTGLWRFAAPYSFSLALLALKTVHVRAVQQKVKKMPTGVVKFFNESKGYGFIAPDDGGNDAFVHISAVERSGMRTLRENQRVGFDLEEDRRGKMAATNLRDADDPAAGGDSGAGQAE